MTLARRTIFGFVASLLLVLGLVKTAETFDPVLLGRRQPRTSDDPDRPVF